MSNFFSTEPGSPRKTVENVSRELELADLTIEAQREALADSARQMLRMEDVGWNLLGGQSEDGMTLEGIKNLGKQLEEWSDTNPLLQRGRDLRNAYLFGVPYEIGTEDATSKISERAMAVFKNPRNQDAVFSQEALASIEAQRYHHGNAFVLWDASKARFYPLPMKQISDAYFNPDDPREVWYYERTYDKQTYNRTTGRIESETTKEWYPTDTYTQTTLHTRINGNPVIKTKRIIDSRVNLKPGCTWGMPDAFAAAPWALAYSAYLRDGTKVLAALAEWTWKLTPKNKNQAETAGVSIKRGGGAGGSIISTMDVQALPKGSAVDLDTGRPLAAQVASALGISVVSLLADPGQSGAYGTAQTLADPTNRTMRFRREFNSQFIKRCLRLIGVKNPDVVWEKMSPGDDKDEMLLQTMAMGTGLFWGDEMRPIVAKIAGITLLHDSEPEGFMLPNNSESLNRKDIDADGEASATANASTVTKNGGTSLSNSQGNDALKVGKVDKSAAKKSQSVADQK